MKRSIFLSLAGLLASMAGSALAGPDEQWVLRQSTENGVHTPSAVFLSWNFDAVIFRARCDAPLHELVIDYYGDGETTLKGTDQIHLADTPGFAMRTRLTSGRLEGRVRVTRRLLTELSRSGELDIDAPNAMGEPWHVGRAAPLVKLARLCG